MAANSDARLVLIVGTDIRALRAVADESAVALGWRTIDLNRELSRRLLPYTAQGRQDEAWPGLEDVIGDQSQGIVLTSTDVLFEPSLDYRPYEALRRIARRGQVIASWFGRVEDDMIVRAEPGHPEYVRVRLDVPVLLVGAEGGTAS